MAYFGGLADLGALRLVGPRSASNDVRVPTVSFVPLNGLTTGQVVAAAHTAKVVRPGILCFPMWNSTYHSYHSMLPIRLQLPPFETGPFLHLTPGVTFVGHQ